LEGAFYNNPASLQKNLTPEIVDRLFNTYQRDLPRQVDYMDEVGRWKIRWDLVDLKLERLLDTLHATNRDLYPANIHHHQYLTDNVGVIDNKREIFKCNMTREILLKVDYWR
jgi:hypothetical protein